MSSPEKITEIEVAYLANLMPDGIADAEPVPYTDIYLSDPDDLLTKMRLRQKGDSYELTKKVVVDPADVSVQDEYNVPLSEREFRLFRGLGGRVLTKDRYTIPMNGRNAEVDVFGGPLHGLVLIEFEFDNPEQRDAFDPPEVCGPDVTQEDFIAGAYLAGKRYEEIADELARFDYKPLSR